MIDLVVGYSFDEVVIAGVRVIGVIDIDDVIDVLPVLVVSNSDISVELGGEVETWVLSTGGRFLVYRELSAILSAQLFPTFLMPNS
jgi:hypothetical protein